MTSAASEREPTRGHPAARRLRDMARRASRRLRHEGAAPARPPPRRVSPSHLATAAVASVLPITLVAERPMSRNWSMPMIRSRPASGMSKLASVAAITTSEARGTPAMPLLVSISSSSIVICWPNESSMP